MEDWSRRHERRKIVFASWTSSSMTSLKNNGTTGSVETEVGLQANSRLGNSECSYSYDIASNEPELENRWWWSFNVTEAMPEHEGFQLELETQTNYIKKLQDGHLASDLMSVVNLKVLTNQDSKLNSPSTLSPCSQSNTFLCMCLFFWQVAVTMVLHHHLPTVTFMCFDWRLSMMNHHLSLSTPLSRLVPHSNVYSLVLLTLVNIFHTHPRAYASVLAIVGVSDRGNREGDHLMAHLMYPG